MSTTNEQRPPTATKEPTWKATKSRQSTNEVPSPPNEASPDSSQTPAREGREREDGVEEDARAPVHGPAWQLLHASRAHVEQALADAVQGVQLPWCERPLDAHLFLDVLLQAVKEKIEEQRPRAGLAELLEQVKEALHALFREHPNSSEGERCHGPPSVL